MDKEFQNIYIYIYIYIEIYIYIYIYIYIFTYLLEAFLVISSLIFLLIKLPVVYAIFGTNFLIAFASDMYA